MKSFRIDDEAALSEDRVLQAIYAPSLGKRSRGDVVKVLTATEEYIKKIQHLVLSGEYKPRRHQACVINEKGPHKQRTIIKPDYYPEQIVHHIAVDSMKEAVLYGMDPFVLGSIPGRGAHYGKKYIQKWIRHDPKNTKVIGKLDIRHFFDSIRHDLCEKIFRDVHMDDALVALAMHFVKMYQVFEARVTGDADKIAVLDRGEGVGVSLGSQISQDLALCAPNALDHYVKDECGVKPFIRYMDDGHAEGSKADMLALRERLMDRARAMGFELHETKTRIVKMSRGFVYLKIRYSTTDTGHVIRRISRDGIVRMRRKLKRLYGLWRKGKVTLDDIFLSVKSWLGNAKKYADSYRTRKRILAQYHSLFKGYRMEGVIA